MTGSKHTAALRRFRVLEPALIRTRWRVFRGAARLVGGERIECT